MRLKSMGLLLGVAALAACAAEVRMSTTTTEVHGQARDAKAGAVVVDETLGAVYVEGLASWPASLLGQEVVASGRLVRKKLIPDPAVAADGSISQGAEGTQLVLEAASWQGAAP
jgi:hypothetical protein